MVKSIKKKAEQRVRAAFDQIWKKGADCIGSEETRCVEMTVKYAARRIVDVILLRNADKELSYWERVAWVDKVTEMMRLAVWSRLEEHVVEAIGLPSADSADGCASAQREPVVLKEATIPDEIPAADSAAGGPSAQSEPVVVEGAATADEEPPAGSADGGASAQREPVVLKEASTPDEKPVADSVAAGGMLPVDLSTDSESDDWRAFRRTSTAPSLKASNPKARSLSRSAATSGGELQVLRAQALQRRGRKLHRGRSRSRKPTAAPVRTIERRASRSRTPMAAPWRRSRNRTPTAAPWRRSGCMTQPWNRPAAPLAERYSTQPLNRGRGDEQAREGGRASRRCTLRTLRHQHGR